MRHECSSHPVAVTRTGMREILIADHISASQLIILNTGTVTRLPSNREQRRRTTNISVESEYIYRRASWETFASTSHKPINIQINTESKCRLRQTARKRTGQVSRNTSSRHSQTHLILNFSHAR